MNKISKVILAAAIVIVVIATVAFNLKQKPGEITFGVIAGSTGAYGVVGESFIKGAELAQEKWNAKNPKMQVKIIKEDDGFDAKKGLTAYKKLTSIDHIDGLVNMTTITIDALYDEVSKTGMPVALGFEQGIEAKNDNIVQLWPGTVPAEAKLGEYVKSKNFKNIVVLVDNGSSAYQRFADGFKKGYSLPVQEIKISGDASDIRSNALKISNIKPDAVVLIVKPTSGALLFKELKLLSTHKYQFIFDANIQTGFTDYEKILGNTSVLDGSIVYTVPNNYRQEFVADFKKKFGVDPAIGSETGYNAFMLLALSYDKDKSKWVTNMQKSSFDGADGKIVFDENGIRIPELKIGTIENGKLPE